MLDTAPDTTNLRQTKPPKQNNAIPLPGFHTMFIKDMRDARKAANWPNINTICKHYGITRDALVLDWDPNTTCYRHLLYNACDRTNCNYNHNPVTKTQIDAVHVCSNLEKFLKDPLELKSTGKKE